MGCASIKSKKDLYLEDVPVQQGKKMEKEEGIVSREYRFNSIKT